LIYLVNRIKKEEGDEKDDYFQGSSCYTWNVLLRGGNYGPRAETRV